MRPRFDDYAVRELARQQDWVIAVRQLTALDVPRSTITHRTRADGPWQRVLPGVYVTHTGSPSRHQRLRAALLYAGDGAMVTGVAALVQYGFRYAKEQGMVHVLVPHRRRRVSKARVQVERTIRPPSPVLVDGVPLAPVARAVVDGARTIKDGREIRAVVAEAVQSGRCEVEDLARELRDGQRRGTAVARAGFRDVRAGIRSVAEGDLRTLIAPGWLPEPEWNVAVFTLDGELVAILDGLYRDVWLGLEIDSIEQHFLLPDWERTMDRDLMLSKKGLEILHIRPKRIRADGPALLADIAEARRNRAGQPRPQLVFRSAAALGPGRIR